MRVKFFASSFYPIFKTVQTELLFLHAYAKRVIVWQ